MRITHFFHFSIPNFLDAIALSLLNLGLAKSMHIIYNEIGLIAHQISSYSLHSSYQRGGKDILSSESFKDQHLVDPFLSSNHI